MMTLTTEEEYRYSRHLILPQVGLQGQERLRRARVLIVGAGGLGSPAALYLAAAGIGTLGIIDDDRVDASNLQRQIMHSVDTVEQLKVLSAASAISRLNPHVTVIPINERITSVNALDIIAGYDLVIDGTDNFATRYLLNDACALLSKPLVFGSIYQFAGQVSLFETQHGPCYRCLYPTPPAPDSVPTCAEGGVLGVLPGIIGALQGLEALKWILRIGRPLHGRLLMVDALSTVFRELHVEKDPACPLCGHHPTVTTLVDYHEFCGVSPEQQSTREWEMTAEQLHERLQTNTSLLLVDVRTEWEAEDLAGFPGARHMPAHKFTHRMHEFDSAQEIIIYCAVGARSWPLTRLLRQAGFTRVWSLRGGLLTYRRQYPGESLYYGVNDA